MQAFRSLACPLCPRRLSCGRASTDEKPQGQAARRWVNIPAATFVPPSPGGTDGCKNVLSKQAWGGQAAPLTCWDWGAAGAEAAPAPGLGKLSRGAAPCCHQRGQAEGCPGPGAAGGHPGEPLGGGWRLWGGRSGSRAGLAGSCRQGFQVVRRCNAQGQRLPGLGSASCYAGWQAPHMLCLQLPACGSVPQG